jgi:hypothetical protein
MELSTRNILTPADLLHYLADYPVMVCSLCQYAVQPTAVSGQSLILLAHYCLVLRRLDGCWNFYGGAREFLGSILQRLGERWRGCVEWPIREIFGHSVERRGVTQSVIQPYQRP